MHNHPAEFFYAFSLERFLCTWGMKRLDSYTHPTPPLKAGRKPEKRLCEDLYPFKEATWVRFSGFGGLGCRVVLKIVGPFWP